MANAFNNPEIKIDVAVVVPCHNEESTIADVIKDFQKHLPQSSIYVFDNASSDKTAEVAATAGATVIPVDILGKGNVVRRMFSDVDADVYIMVDGDGTYDASISMNLVETLLSGHYDMVNVARQQASDQAYRPGHALGNRTLTGLVGWLFGSKTTDMLSGYKAFSRRFVKTFPAMSHRFEIETELLIHALELQLPVAEIKAPYDKRPDGSSSKLNTYRDGLRILKFISWLFKHEKPLPFFSVIAAILLIVSLVLGVPVIIEFFDTGLVPRLPTALLSAIIMLLSIQSLFTGLILDTVTYSRREIKRLFYLNYRPSGHTDR